MAIPDWTVDLLKRQLNEVAEHLKRPETMQQMRERATEFLQDLPQAASRAWDQAREGMQGARGFSAAMSPDGGVLNGTGAYLGGDVTTTPISEEAIAAGANLLRSFQGPAAEMTGWLEREASRVAKSAGVPQVLVASRVESAVLAIGSLALEQGASVFVPRCCAVGLPGGMPLTEMLMAAGCHVIEFGSAEAATASDWERLKLAEGDFVVQAGADCLCKRPDVAADVVVVGYVPGVVLKPLPDAAEPAAVAASDLVGESCDVLITGGGGLLGGPDCGLLMGQAAQLDAVATLPQWSALEASTETRAMLLVAMQQEPLFQQALAASEENLQHRAQSLATRLAAAGEADGGQVRQCLVSAQPARLVAGAKTQVPSRQLRLKHSELSASDWAAQLAAGSPAVLTKVDDDSVVIDLRWIDVAQDHQLAEVVAGKSLAPSDPPAASPAEPSHAE